MAGAGPLEAAPGGWLRLLGPSLRSPQLPWVLFFAWQSCCTGWGDSSYFSVDPMVSAGLAQVGPFPKGSWDWGCACLGPALEVLSFLCG